MPRKNFAGTCALLLVLLLALCACSEPQSQNQLSGLLLGFDGGPMKYAQIRVKPLYALTKEEATLIDVDSDGHYAFDFDKPGRYTLMFMGVGHLPTTLIVDYQQQNGLVMDVQLDRLPFRDNPDKVMVALYTGIVEGKEKPARHALSKAENGHFTADIDLPAGPVKYQVTGLVDGNYSVEDAQASSFVTSMYGNFHSLAQHEGGEWKVDITPPAPGPNKAKTPLGLSGPWLEQAKTIELLSEYNRVLTDQRIARKEAKEGDFEYAAGLETLKEWRETFKGTQLQPLVLAMSTGIAGQDHAIHTQAVEDIAVDSWLWSLNGVGFPDSVASSGPSDEELAEDTRAFRQFNHYDAKVKQFLAQNADYEAKAEVVMYLAYLNRKAGETEQYQRYFDDFKENYTDAWSYDFYLKILQPSKLDKGAVAPVFEIVSLDNPDIVYSNSSFKDKVYLLDFWATWCTPCLKELPGLHEIYSRFHDQGFEILSLSADLFVEDVTKFRQGKWKMPWKHAFLQNGEHPIIESYDVFGYPTAYLIDENGRILATGDKVRGEQLEQTLASYYDGKEQL
jgi:thiol-disulfide isomerase/thioredoxin